MDGAAEDAVDDLIETVLQMGGRVTFFPPGTLEKNGRVCATLRF
jgi:hypothetical protein